MIYPAWLPPPLSYVPFLGNEEAYIEAAYARFCNDFKTSQPVLYSKPVFHDKRLTYRGKEETFWHLISKDSGTTQQRIPDFERCERLPWIRPLIESVESNSEVLTWEQTRRDSRQRATTRRAILLSHEQFAHIVFLQERERFFQLVTTYHVSPGHRLNKYLSEYDEYTSRR